jgi:hypothetical integral membrane protein (TIGR02206 family)
MAPMANTADAHEFISYGPSHQVVIVLLLVGGLALVRLGRAFRGDQRGVRLAKVLSVALLLATVPLQLVAFMPGRFDLEHTLPLQLCDLASFVAAYALWTRRPWATALTYFWGLTLTTQAIITPDLSRDFPDRSFMLFWAMHLLIIWAAVYLTWGLRLAPDWRRYRATVGLTAVWAVSVFSFNHLAGTNYGYLNAKPGSASVLDLLGPWPSYVLAEIAIVAAVWALMTWPWVPTARRRGPVGSVQGLEGASS